jgi:hypothetical protein
MPGPQVQSARPQATRAQAQAQAQAQALQKEEIDKAKVAFSAAVAAEEDWCIKTGGGRVRGDDGRCSSVILDVCRTQLSVYCTPARAGSRPVKMKAVPVGATPDELRSGVYRCRIAPASASKPGAARLDVDLARGRVLPIDVVLSPCRAARAARTTGGGTKVQEAFEKLMGKLEKFATSLSETSMATSLTPASSGSVTNALATLADTASASSIAAQQNGRLTVQQEKDDATMMMGLVYGDDGTTRTYKYGDKVIVSWSCTSGSPAVSYRHPDWTYDDTSNSVYITRNPTYRIKYLSCETKPCKRRTEQPA